MKKFKTFQTQNPEANELQRNIVDFTQQLYNPLLSGVFHTVTLLAAGTNVVNHGLGRTPLGWIVVSKSSNSNVWSQPIDQVLPTSNLVLRASADTIVKLYIF